MYKQAEKKTSPFCLYQKNHPKKQIIVCIFVYYFFFSSTLLMCYLDF